MCFFSIYLWMMSYLWFHLTLLFNKKISIKKNQSLVRTHAYYNSRIEITNKSHSTPLFNVLATGGRRLDIEIQKPKIN